MRRITPLGWGFVIDAVLWVLFFTVRLHERRFGTGSEVTFCLALSGPVLWGAVLSRLRGSSGKRDSGAA